MVEFLEAWRWRDAKHSYAQAGEDLIIDFVVKAMQIEDITYLDIGAHHPTQFSNTYLFYKRGHKGVLVEPDPDLSAVIRQVRPRDKCIEAGVGLHSTNASKFFVMSTRTLNTFSESEAKRYESMGTQRIEKDSAHPNGDIGRDLCRSLSRRGTNASVNRCGGARF